MGKAFYEAFPEAREIWHEANDALGFEVATLAFGGALTRIPALGTVRPPAWSALAMFALLTLALLWAGRRNRQIDREIPNSPNR